MRDHTFYIVCAYGMTALLIAFEIFWIRRQRQRAIIRARQLGQQGEPASQRGQKVRNKQ